MRAWMIAAAIVIGTSAEAASQELGSHYAALEAKDMYNSSGKRLTDFCQTVQQDRANYHRFKRRDNSDEGDPFFSSAETRQMIAQACFNGAGQNCIVDDVLGGFPRHVWVQVFGSGGQITAVVVNKVGGRHRPGGPLAPGRADELGVNSQEVIDPLEGRHGFEDSLWSCAVEAVKPSWQAVVAGLGAGWRGLGPIRAGCGPHLLWTADATTDRATA